MKTPMPFCIAGVLLLFSQFGYGQENNNKLNVFISGGPALTAGKTRDSLFMGNGWQLEAGAYMPLFSSKKNATTHSTKGFSMGIEASIHYAQQAANGGAAVYTSHFSLQGAALQPGFEGGTAHAHIFQIAAGPSAQWDFGKIYFSPAVTLGYFSLNGNGYTLSQRITNPKQQTESSYIPFIAATGYTASGFVIKPTIELGYQPGQQWAVFTRAGIAFGPSIENNFAYWQPKGNGSSSDAYSYDQFASGSPMTRTANSHWRTSAISLGLRYTFTKRKTSSGLQSGAGALSQGASMQVKDSGSTSMPSRLSMTPTTARQTQGNNFGEKVAGGLQSGAGALAQGASMQVKDSGSTSMPSRLSMTPTTARQTQGSNFGEKVASGLQSGAGALSQGASMQVKDSGSTSMPSRLSMTPTTARQTQGSNFGEKAAGKPLPGIIVKCRNLSAIGSDGTEKPLLSVSDENGSIILHNLKAGSYQFSLADKHGKPMKGVILKGDGNAITAISNINGMIQFTIQQTGDYKFVLQAPKNSVRKNWHETAKNSISNVR